MPFLPIKELFPPGTQSPFLHRPKEGVPKCLCHWQYMDTKRQMQGPFTSAQMRLWYEHDMLPKGLQLRRTTDVAFATIPEYFPKHSTPFHSAPTTPASRAPEPNGYPSYPGLGAFESAMASAYLNHPAPITSMAGTGYPGMQAHLLSQAKAAAQPQAAQVPTAQPKAKVKNTASQQEQPQPKSKAAKAAQNLEARVDVGGPEPKAKAEPKVKAKAKGKKAQQHQQQEQQQQQQQQQQQDQPNPNQQGGTGNQQWNGWSGDWWSGADGASWGGDWSSWDQWSANGGADWPGAQGNGRGHNKGGDAWKGAHGEGPNAAPPKGSVEKNQIAILKWGPKAEPSDLLPEELTQRVSDEGII